MSAQHSAPVPAPSLDVRFRAGADIAIGIALLIAPVIATAIKMVSSGWLTFVLMMAGIVWVPMWILIAVIVFTSFFARRNPYRWVRGGVGRSRVAGWLHVGTLILTMLLVPDFGDSPGAIPPPVAVLLGVPAPIWEPLAVVAAPLAVICCLAAVWLVVEWIVALVARRRATRPAPIAAPAWPQPPQ
jgi:hypothetical protein